MDIFGEILGTLYLKGPKRNPKGPKRNPKGPKRNPKGTQKGMINNENYIIIRISGENKYLGIF